MPDLEHGRVMQTWQIDAGALQLLLSSHRPLTQAEITDLTPIITAAERYVTNHQTPEADQ